MSSIKLFTRNALEHSFVECSQEADEGFLIDRLYDRSIDFGWRISDVDYAEYLTIIQPLSNIVELDHLILGRNNSDSKIWWILYYYDDVLADYVPIVDPFMPPSGEYTTGKSFTALTERTFKLLYNPDSVFDLFCSEIFLSKANELRISDMKKPTTGIAKNVDSVLTVGGSIRQIKNGYEKRNYSYFVTLDEIEYASLSEDLSFLAGYSKPFFIQDHEDEYVFVRFRNNIAYEWVRPDVIRIQLDLVEI